MRNRAAPYNCSTNSHNPNHEKIASLLLLATLAACGNVPARQSEASAAQMNELVMYAMSLADTPYRYGGNSAGTGFDCSGYVRHVYAETLAIRLPRTSNQISRVGIALDRDQLRPGDLVFYNTQRRPNSHVGLYIGDGKFVHAPKSGERIRVERMSLDYWKTRYNGARRIR